MILLNENNDRKVYYLDLEKGKIIEELVSFKRFSLIL